MLLHLTAELEQRLKQLAAQTGRTSDELAQEALDGYLKHVEPLMADICEAEESAEREGWLTNEEVFESLNKRLMKPARGSSGRRAQHTTSTQWWTSSARRSGRGNPRREQNLRLGHAACCRCPHRQSRGCPGNPRTDLQSMALHRRLSSQGRQHPHPSHSATPHNSGPSSAAPAKRSHPGG